ncbi:hypothetical protein [Elizabethkingia anophelis]|uniref:DUF5681 domain-containing protein n=1 Tax=Elizabethkingia anophelis TaxID=1117645 RepID=A0A494J1W7_9FLAO|nr:hypothetical protein [Elizabethkingia anophelis]AQX52541.1 hypothetical protein AYC66_18465 [Elizabethkingia anophelis]EJC8061950.1 hypothetical protein [Elizabethkingia anophelis]MCL1640040.1 hypothetical protein [Elizabethkingia anophelis]MCL1646569.1 hypothetical protein [Elizabethkingia anophelis]MCT3926921.1 hypothetical protein [Elizabethkingia anophelis]
MAGGNRKINEHPNAGKGGFAQNPQNINRTGANRKSFAAVNDALKKKGIQALTKKELIEFYTLIFNATEDELKRLVADKKQPLALRYIIAELNDKTTRSKAIADLRNYMFGQAQQEINHTVKARVLTPEEVKQHFKDLEDNY